MATTTCDAASKPFRFFDLPAELRANVYENLRVLHTEESVGDRHDFKDLPLPWLGGRSNFVHASPNYLALTKASRRLRDESLPFLLEGAMISSPIAIFSIANVNDPRQDYDEIMARLREWTVSASTCLVEFICGVELWLFSPFKYCVLCNLQVKSLIQKLTRLKAWRDQLTGKEILKRDEYATFWINTFSLLREHNEEGKLPLYRKV
ncbi:hypothetical protein K431DRAFT_302598 [Polychaeton citri CBS 116435]|uniref:F-box domain-containing protein n=1 Tax=Polychaeton citri CBS 116435 TaxID=1314669 RepID=A0A9P4URE5_9PEZI|nr:hypothetical protein K431DRAFT_302598 [Polychaeton citri CBS 116435]